MGLDIKHTERIHMGYTARDDCAKSGITVNYKITEVAYYDFLSEYEPALIHGDVETATTAADAAHHGDAEPEPEPQLELEVHGTESHHGTDEDDVATLSQVIEQEDETIAAKDEELAAKDEQLVQSQATNVAQAEKLTALGEELTALRALLQSQVRYQVHSLYTVYWDSRCMRFWGAD